MTFEQWWSNGVRNESFKNRSAEHVQLFKNALEAAWNASHANTLEALGDKEMDRQWKRDTRQYARGSILYLGKWAVGGSHYDGTRNRDDPKKYHATCRLPGIKGAIGHFATDAEARKAVEGAVKYWLGGLPSNAEDKPPSEAASA